MAGVKSTLYRGAADSRINETTKQTFEYFLTKKNICYCCPHHDLRGKSAFPRPQLFSSLLPEHCRGFRVQINGETNASMCKTCLISVPKEKTSITLPARHPPQCAADAKHTHTWPFFHFLGHRTKSVYRCSARHSISRLQLDTVARN